MLVKPPVGGVCPQRTSVLMTVAADNIVTADQFAALVANESADMTGAFVARVLNALNEAVQDIVNAATVAPNIDFGWGKFLFEIAGSLDTATGTPGSDNYCYFSGSVASKYQKQFALMDAYVDVSANPCDFKRVRDAGTSALNVIYGNDKFYAEGRGFTWGAATDKRELYKLDGTKVCDLTLTTGDSYSNCLTLKIPTTATAAAGEYIVRIDCTILGKVWRMERKVTLAQAVVPAFPSITSVTGAGRETGQVGNGDIVTAVGTNFSELKAGDDAIVITYQAETGSKEFKVSKANATVTPTSIVLGVALPTDIALGTQIAFTAYFANGDEAEQLADVIA